MKIIGKEVAECLCQTRSVLLQWVNFLEDLFWTTGIWINAFIILSCILSVSNELLLSIKALIGRRNLGAGKSPADHDAGLLSAGLTSLNEWGLVARVNLKICILQSQVLLQCPNIDSFALEFQVYDNSWSLRPLSQTGMRLLSAQLHLASNPPGQLEEGSSRAACGRCGISWEWICSSLYQHTNYYFLPWIEQEIIPFPALKWSQAGLIAVFLYANWIYPGEKKQQRF